MRAMTTFGILQRTALMTLVLAMGLWIAAALVCDPRRQRLSAAAGADFVLGPSAGIPLKAVRGLWRGFSRRSRMAQVR